MELCVFIAESSEEKARNIKDELRRLACFSDIDSISFYTCSMFEVLHKILASQIEEFHMAFISMEFPNPEEVGMLLYRTNPACRLIYYKDGMTDLLPLMPSRPVWYWNCQDRFSMHEIWNKQICAIQDDSCFFQYSDRLRSLAVPYVAIRCAYSAQRSVHLHTKAQDYGPISKPLDWIQARFPEKDYIRVHQSFLVRRKSIRYFDNGAKTLTLDDGFEVPVSRAFYASVRAFFDQKDSVDS